MISLEWKQNVENKRTPAREKVLDFRAYSQNSFWWVSSTWRIECEDEQSRFPWNLNKPHMSRFLYSLSFVLLLISDIGSMEEWYLSSQMKQTSEAPVREKLWDQWTRLPRSHFYQNDEPEKNGNLSKTDLVNIPRKWVVAWAFSLLIHLKCLLFKSSITFLFCNLWNSLAIPK